MIDLSKPVVDNVTDKECLYSCKEPRGSMLVGIGVTIVGFVFIPVFVAFLETATPITVDTFLLFMLDEFSKIIGYISITSFYSYVLYFVFSFLGGMVCVNPVKALALPFVVLAVSILGFLFLALFITGTPINYETFFIGLMNNWLVLAIAIIFPSLLGSVATRVSLSKKSCFVKGSGITVKE